MTNITQDQIDAMTKCVKFAKWARVEMEAGRLVHTPEGDDARPQPTVSVKPLVWEGFIIGPYEITVNAAGVADLHNHGSRDEYGEIECIKGGYLTLVSIDDLKAAAQSDHDRRILSAITVTPSDPIDDDDALTAAYLAGAHAANPTVQEAAQVLWADWQDEDKDGLCDGMAAANTYFKQSGGVSLGQMIDGACLEFIRVTSGGKP